MPKNHCGSFPPSFQSLTQQRRRRKRSKATSSCAVFPVTNPRSFILRWNLYACNFIKCYMRLGRRSTPYTF